MTNATLVLLRHAKAEPPQQFATDAERPLSVRGHADAVVAGTWLAEQGLIPDRVLCSPALRTRQTWEHVAAAMSTASPVVAYVPSMYDAGAEAVLRTIAQTSDDVRTLLVVGHNPVLSIASGYLDPAGGDGGSLRTAGIAVHTVEGPWSALAPARAPRTRALTARA
jgi:phosphohistidine phosphatase